MARREHKAGLSTRDRIGSAAAVVFGVVALLAGVYTLWAQHSGVSAAVTVIECHTIGTKYHSQECTGQWSGAGGPRSVLIESAGTPQVGDVLAMRIHGSKAYATSLWLPLELFGGGLFMVAVGVYVAVVVRRRGGPVRGLK